jgi:hypothetical protein
MISLYQQRVLNEHEEYLKQYGASNSFKPEFKRQNDLFDFTHKKLSKLINKERSEVLFADFY